MMLLHTCCADCTLKFIHDLKEQPDLYFYNPNIHPRSEYQSRLLAIQKVAKKTGSKLIVPDWSPKDYFTHLPSSKTPSRCHHCWQLRLSKTAEFATKHNYNSFSSTLIISHYQDQKTIQSLGQKIGQAFLLDFFIPPYPSCDLKTSGFYKQFFCGCCYSLQERFEEKYQTVKIN